MRSLEPPDAPQGRVLWWILLVAALVTGAGAWYISTRPASSPAGSDTSGTKPAPAPSAAGESVSPGPPTSANDKARATERSTTSNRDRAAADRAGRSPRAAAAPTPAPAGARELRVSSDVDGAYVFLDRKFLGTTPLVSRDVAPGTHQLNVQLEGRPPVVRTIEVAQQGPTDVTVSLPPAAAAAAAGLNAAVPVVHQHAAGSCEGTLRANAGTFRYDTTHKDAFSLPFAAVETFTVDYAGKRLRLKQRGGRTWNFSTHAPNADPLFVFHRDVEAARQP